MHILFNRERLRFIVLSFACVVLQGCSTLEDWTQAARQSLSPHTSTRGTALINGKDLNAWKLVGNANWRLQDGQVQAELGDAIAFDAPQGGMFFWARLTGANGKPTHAGDFANQRREAEAADRQVLVAVAIAAHPLREDLLHLLGDEADLREARALRQRQASDVIAQFLEQFGYSRIFIEDHILPISAAIWSTPSRGMLDFPARTFIEFFAKIVQQIFSS